MTYFFKHHVGVYLCVHLPCSVGKSKELVIRTGQLNKSYSIFRHKGSVQDFKKSGVLQLIELAISENVKAISLANRFLLMYAFNFFLTSIVFIDAKS